MKETKGDPQQIIDALPSQLPPVYEEGQKFPEESEDALKGLGSIWDDPKYKPKKEIKATAARRK